MPTRLEHSSNPNSDHEESKLKTPKVTHQQMLSYSILIHLLSHLILQVYLWHDRHTPTRTRLRVGERENPLRPLFLIFLIFAPLGMYPYVLWLWWKQRKSVDEADVESLEGNPDETPGEKGFVQKAAGMSLIVGENAIEVYPNVQDITPDSVNKIVLVDV